MISFFFFFAQTEQNIPPDLHIIDRMEETVAVVSNETRQKELHTDTINKNVLTAELKLMLIEFE